MGLDLDLFPAGCGCYRGACGRPDRGPDQGSFSTVGDGSAAADLEQAPGFFAVDLEGLRRDGVNVVIHDQIDQQQQQFCLSRQRPCLLDLPHQPVNLGPRGCDGLPLHHQIFVEVAFVAVAALVFSAVEALGRPKLD